MPRLFIAGPESVKIYTERTPGNAAGGASVMTTATLASGVFLVLVGVVPVALALTNATFARILSRFEIPVWIFLFFAACGAWNLAGECRAVIFDGAKGKVYVRGRFSRRCVADFSEVAGLRFFETEDDDGVTARECGVSFTDAARPFLPVSQKLYDEPHLSVFRDTVMPRVAALLSRGSAAGKK